MTVIADWSKSFKHIPRDNIISHALAKSDKFVVSFAREKCPPTMSLLISWEYGRIWLKECDAFRAKRAESAKPKRISNSFKWWLDKRKKKDITSRRHP